MTISFNPFTGNFEMGESASVGEMQSMTINGVEVISSERVLSNVTLSGVTVDGGEY